MEDRGRQPSLPQKLGLSGMADRLLSGRL